MLFTGYVSGAQWYRCHYLDYMLLQVSRLHKSEKNAFMIGTANLGNNNTIHITEIRP